MLQDKLSLSNTSSCNYNVRLPNKIYLKNNNSYNKNINPIKSKPKRNITESLEKKELQEVNINTVILRVQCYIYPTKR